MADQTKREGSIRHRFSILSGFLSTILLAAVASPALLRIRQHDYMPMAEPAGAAAPLSLPMRYRDSAMPARPASKKAVSAFSENANDVTLFTIIEDAISERYLFLESRDWHTGTLNWTWASDLPFEGIPRMVIIPDTEVILLTFRSTHYMDHSAPEIEGYDHLVFVSLETGDVIESVLVEGAVSELVMGAGMLQVDVDGRDCTYMLFRVDGRLVERVKYTPRVFVTVDPPRSKIFLDDRYVGTGPLLPIRLPDGNHSLRVECDGYSPTWQTVDVEPGKAGDIHIVLKASIDIRQVRGAYLPTAQRASEKSPVKVGKIGESEVYYDDENRSLIVVESESGKIIWHMKEINDLVLFSSPFLIFSKEWILNDKGIKLFQVMRPAEPCCSVSTINTFTSSIVFVADFEQMTIAIGVGEDCLEGYNVEDGELVWRTMVEGYTRSSKPLIQAWQGFAFVADETELLAYDCETGKRVWSHTFDTPVQRLGRQGSVLHVSTADKTVEIVLGNPIS